MFKSFVRLAAVIVLAPALVAQASAASDLYAQRRALLAADDGCALLSSPARTALAAMTTQSRNALVRAGWSSSDLASLERQAVSAGRGRACADPALTAAARSATTGYEGWRRLNAQSFPAAETTWFARRTPDPDGWYMWQDAVGPAKVRFGVRAGEKGPELVAAAPGPSPASAALRLRDVGRALTPGFEAPGRAARTLADRAPMATESVGVLAQSRKREVTADKTTRTVFVFDAAVLDRLSALDTREAARLDLTGADGVVRSVFVEVGDLQAARAFVALR